MTDYGYGAVAIDIDGVCLGPLVQGFDELSPKTVLPIFFEDSQASELVIVAMRGSVYPDSTDRCQRGDQPQKKMGGDIFVPVEKKEREHREGEKRKLGQTHRSLFR